MYFIYFFTYNLFNDAFISSDYIVSNDRMTVNNELDKDVEGSGHGLLQATILEFAWRDGGKPIKTLLGIAGLQAEI
jgi:hypothetical protein